jgi:hypothetical protein
MWVVASISISIEHTVEKVFDYLADLSNYPQWFVAIESMQKQGGREGSGARYLETARVPGFGEQAIDVTVTHLERPRLQRFDASLAPLYPRFSLRLDPVSDRAVQLQWLCETRNYRFLFQKLMMPMAGALLHKRSTQSLDRLKILLGNKA